MNHLPHDLITHWLSHYGSIALFILLAVGIFGLPIPDETLLVVAGFLMAKGHLSWYATIPSAFLGTIVGITSSYIIGYTAGRILVLKYGKYLGITPENYAKAHQWFEKIGKYCLLISYYIPGVRHLAGILAGTTYLRFWEFALFAYTGAIIWASTFLSIGYFFYDAWHQWILHGTSRFLFGGV